MLEPRGNIHSVAVSVVAIDNDLAKINAYPKPDPPRAGRVCVEVSHPTLDFDCAANRIDGTCELDQRAVAHQLHDAAAMLSYERLDGLGAKAPEPVERVFLVGLGQAAVAGHVGRKDCRELSPKALFGHFVGLSPTRG